jgi:hypothetical protein
MPSCTASNPSHDFVLVHPLCCNDDRAGEIGRTFHFMTRHDLVLANDTSRATRDVAKTGGRVSNEPKGGRERPQKPEGILNRKPRAKWGRSRFMTPEIATPWNM